MFLEGGGLVIIWVEFGRKLRAVVKGIVEWVVLGSVGFLRWIQVIWGGFVWWNGWEMVEGEGWVAG